MKIKTKLRLGFAFLFVIYLFIGGIVGSNNLLGKLINEEEQTIVKAEKFAGCIILLKKAES